MVEIGDTTPTERLKDAVTSPYDIEDSDLEALLIAIGNQFEDIEREQDNVLTAKFVDDATGEQLEKLGEFVQISSQKGESTSEFRQRIKANIRSKLASGTYDEVEELVGVLLGVDPSLLNTREFFKDDSPSFAVRLPVDDVGERDLNTRALRPLINDVSAVGVNGTASLLTPSATITVRSSSVIIPEMYEGDNGTFTLSVSTNIAEMYEALLADISLTAANVAIAQMFEASAGAISISSGDTTHIVLYDEVLSSSDLNELSSDGWTGVEYNSATLTTDSISVLGESTPYTNVFTQRLSSYNLGGLSAGFDGSSYTTNVLSSNVITSTAGSVSVRTIPPLPAVLFVGDKAVSTTDISDNGLSNGESVVLSSATDGVVRNSNEFSSDSVRLTPESVTVDTIPPLPETLYFSGEPTSTTTVSTVGLSNEQALTLSSDAGTLSTTGFNTPA